MEFIKTVRVVREEPEYIYEPTEVFMGSQKLYRRVKIKISDREGYFKDYTLDEILGEDAADAE